MPLAVARDQDRSAVKFHELLDDREADTHAAVVSHGAALLLREAVERIREKLGEDPRARVFDFHDDA